VSTAERFQAKVRKMATSLPPRTQDPEAVALGIYATLIGTLHQHYRHGAEVDRESAQ
jgi:hypothetical protein